MLAVGAHILIAAGAMIWIYLIWPWLFELHEAIRSALGRSLDERLDRIRKQGRGAGMEKDPEPKTWGWQAHERQRTWQEYAQRKAEAPWPKQVSQRERHLNTLGFSAAPDASALRERYRSLAKEWHPDRFAASASAAKRAEAVTRMREINAAYDWLSENPV